jgi:antitoxin (DNA-binding transcriptional repressor) of toxin-antitoxin stability system
MTATLEQVPREWLRLVRLVEQGEEVVITRQGRAVAKLSGVTPPKPPAGSRKDWLARLARLREGTATGKVSPTSEDILADLRSERG